MGDLVTKPKADYKFDMAMKLILQGAKQLGWSVLVDGSDEKDCNGVVMGTKTWIAENFEVSDPDALEIN